MNKILIITYYWPPSGGAGVQRWLKLSKYLVKNGIRVYVLTVDEKYASYPITDYSLNAEVDDDTIVIKTKSLEPIKLYEKIVGKKNVPTAGFANTDNNRTSQKIVNSLRSNFFIPDPRRGWNYFALGKAIELIRKEGIRFIITSSPPHSTQLVGLQLKKMFHIKWIADLRDPWTDIYYYNLLGHSFISHKINKYYEKAVIQNSNKIITINDEMVDLFYQKIDCIDRQKFEIVPNGYDHEDFVQRQKGENKFFEICYTGKMSDQYKPEILFEVLDRFIRNYSPENIRITFVGKISKNIKNKINKSDFSRNARIIPYVNHAKSIEYMTNSDLLLLIIPDIIKSELITTGKIFEYIAVNKPILCLGPIHGNAAKIIKDYQAGICFDRESGELIYNFLENSYRNRGEAYSNKREIVKKYSRKYQAEQIIKILNKMDKI